MRPFTTFIVHRTRLSYYFTSVKIVNQNIVLDWRAAYARITLHFVARCKVVRRAFLLCLLVASLACGTGSHYEPCRLNDRMLKDCDLSLLDSQCEVSQTDCYATCVVLDHPECPDGPCMLFQYRPQGSAEFYRSGPFCAAPCTQENSTCPDGGMCIKAAGAYYCVPASKQAVQR